MSAFAAGIAVALVCQIGVSADSPIEPHAETQGLISSWVATANRADAPEHFRLLAEIEAIARLDYARFAEQVVYFVYQLEGENKQAAPIVYRLFVYCVVPESDIAKGLGKHLYSDNAKLRELVRRLFPFSFFGGGRRCDGAFSLIKHLVVGTPEDKNLAGALSRMMFESMPSEAFLAFHTEAAANEMVDLRRLERAISNALYEKNHLGGIEGGTIDASTVTAVQKLAMSRHWWSRMFAAEIMVQNKEFRDSALISRLLEDENVLVRNSVASIEKPDSLRASKVDQ